MCCTGERSAIATNDYVGKGSSPWCREFELARVISFDPFKPLKQTEVVSFGKMIADTAKPVRIDPDGPSAIQGRADGGDDARHRKSFRASLFVRGC